MTKTLDRRRAPEPGEGPGALAALVVIAVVVLVLLPALGWAIRIVVS